MGGDTIGRFCPFQAPLAPQRTESAQLREIYGTKRARLRRIGNDWERHSFFLLRSPPSLANFRHLNGGRP